MMGSLKLMETRATAKTRTKYGVLHYVQDDGDYYSCRVEVALEIWV
jgi:hypothetical protein